MRSVELYLLPYRTPQALTFVGWVESRSGQGGGERVDQHKAEVRAGGLQDDWHLKLRTNRGRGDCRARGSCLDRNREGDPSNACWTGATLFGPHTRVLSDQTPRGFSTEITIFRKVSCWDFRCERVAKVHELKLESCLLVDVVEVPTYWDSLLYKEIVQRRNR